MRDTGYGSNALLRACRVAPAWGRTPGGGPRAVWARFRAGSAVLFWYRRSLPVTNLRVTSSPVGRMIMEHFAIRDGRRWRYRRAQGVLALPPDFASYLRGRHKQAIRTNVGHARKAGLRVLSCAIDNWAPGAGDARGGHLSPGPVERWYVVDANDAIVADAIVSVDGEVALLHGLVSWAPNARWLLHTTIVERLCGSCRILVTNSEDIYLLSAGNLHFQRLLGYEVTRLRILLSPDTSAPAGTLQPAGLSWPPEGLSCGFAASPAPALATA
ncbi:MAG TPA: hypothetical protein VMH33_04190 [Solirubrobacterales bacterium]|nr:hypothetical protein [Solirubrobacterales bacterium]